MNEFEDENVERVSLVDTDEEVFDEKKKKPILLIILVVLGLIAGGAAVWIFVIDKAPGGMVEVQSEEPERKGPPKKPPPFGQVYSLTDIIVNPSGQRRVFMVSIAVEVFDVKALDELKRREPLLRDNLITLFSSQPIEVLADIRYRQAFRARVKKVMDYQLGEGIVTRVFFDKWVFQ